MKISLNWIKDYIDIPKNITPEKLGELLTLHSVEVEGIERQGEFLDGVVVGEILEIKNHPNADKLNIAKVDVGEDKPRQIVFGQMVKMEVGFKTPVALAPTILPGNKKIEKAKLRGEVSEGMLCLDQEMGLKKGGVDIHLFDKSTKNGTPIVKALNLDDVILEVDNKTITHRPDLWGHYGMVREIGAIVKSKIESRKSKVEAHSIARNIHRASNLSVEIRNYDLCRRYIGVVVDNIKIGPSPQWIQNRLSAVGVRSINNVVDITNYIMFDIGQPLHAFDYDKLFSKTEKDGVKIIVRNARAGEKITTLDGVERKLDDTMLVIADEKKPIALAGVMGGGTSEVDESTKRIVIEIANFEPINIRQTSAKIGLRTESVMRFEKSLDPNLPQAALNKVLNLIDEIIMGAEQASKVVDEKKFKLSNASIKLSLDYVQKKIGIKISSGEVARILESLGFEIASQARGVGGLKIDTIFEVKVPTWRATKDVSIADDLVEEVARIYGFNNIKAVAPLVKMEAPKVNQMRQFERRLKNILNGLGFDEVYNYALIGAKQIKKVGKNPDEHIKLINSLSIDLEFLRQRLIENLLVNIRDNLRYFDTFKIFEVGSVFYKRAGKYLAHPDKKDMLPEQKKMIAGVVVDTEKKAEDIFSQTKEAAENLFTKLSVTNYSILPYKESKKTKAEIVVKDEKVGSIILVDKNIQDNFDINSKISCGYFEVDLDKLFSVLKDDFKYQPLAKFPETKIDLAVVAPKEILWHNIVEEIKITAGVRLKKIELFDIYEGKNISSGKKSFAMHLNFGEDERTMEMDEVEKLRDRIVKNLKEKLDIDIRS